MIALYRGLQDINDSSGVSSQVGKGGLAPQRAVPLGTPPCPAQIGSHSISGGKPPFLTFETWKLDGTR
jgi:hypothetical protein